MSCKSPNWCGSGAYVTQLLGKLKSLLLRNLSTLRRLGMLNKSESRGDSLRLGKLGGGGGSGGVKKLLLLSSSPLLKKCFFL